MPVTITVTDELAERLARQAESRKVSFQQWAIQVLERAPEFTAQADAWHELNARRICLIRKRHQDGLSTAEESELAELQSTADRWLEPGDHQRLKLLEPFEELASRLGTDNE